jgi:hypothetical protein
MSLQSRFHLGQMLHGKTAEGVASCKFAISIVFICKDKKPRAPLLAIARDFAGSL